MKLKYFIVAHQATHHDYCRNCYMGSYGGHFDTKFCETEDEVINYVVDMIMSVKQQELDYDFVVVQDGFSQALDYEYEDEEDYDRSHLNHESSYGGEIQHTHLWPKIEEKVRTCKEAARVLELERARRVQQQEADKNKEADLKLLSKLKSQYESNKPK